MSLSEEVLRMWRLFLCFGSYGRVFFYDVKKACYDKSADTIVK